MVVPSQEGAVSRVLFFGFFAEPLYLQRVFQLEANPQVSAIKFQTSLLHGLEANHSEVTLLAALPIAAWPRNPMIYIRKKEFTIPGTHVRGLLMPCINLPGLRLLSRLATSLYYGFKLQCKYRYNAIISYSLHTPMLLPARAIQRLFRVPLLLFILDLPHYMSGYRGSWWRRVMKRLDNAILRWLANGADLIFPVTAAIGRDWLASNVTQHIIECVTPVGIPRAPVRVRATRSPRVLYTGTFSQMERFIRLFCASKAQLELVLIGGGPDDAVLKEVSSNDPRVTIKPFMLGETLDAEMNQADFFLNPRDTQWGGGQYSFPSKLYDYMARGKPVITTPLACIPPEYFRSYLVVSDSDVASFEQSLNAALTTSEEEQAARVAIGYELLERRSPANVGKIIVEAIRARQHAAGA